eukprot:GCRY01005101.1.p1 GENE.GCRY01005101.1~~GCRY01005101.1.p1  ORF type:complete len:350 (-),score=71.34 GCRY01005101.1:788-1837(-)
MNTKCGETIPFSKTTHARFWIFSEEELAQKRRAVYEQFIRKSNAPQPVESKQDTSFSSPVSGRKRSSSFSMQTPSPPKKMKTGKIIDSVKIPESDVLTCEEEAIIRRLFAHKMCGVCKALKLGAQVLPTALMFFKRFYVDNSVMVYDPKLIMLVCVYIACKAEEFNLIAGEFARFTKVEEADILDNELLVLSKIRFHLVVFHPNKPVQGFVSDMQEFVGQQGPAQSIAPHEWSADSFTALATAATALLDKLHLSDLCLSHSPSNLALAALRSAGLAAGFSIDTYIQQRFKDLSVEDLGTFLGTIRTLSDRLLADSRITPPDKDQFKPVAQKLKKVKQLLAESLSNIAHC